MPCRIRFAGAVAIDEKELVSNSKDLLKGEYSKTFVENFANANLKPLYRKIGHLRVKFTNVTARPADEAVCNGVIVSMKVEEGDAYTWDGAMWVNNLSFSSKELDSNFGMTVGEIADGTKIDKGFAAIRKAYSRKGYLTVRFKAEEDFDDDTKKVSYHINVSEGVQYRMGTLTIKGLPEDVLPRLQEKWKLKPGDVYDDLYVNEFIDTVLVKETSLQLLMRNNSKVKQYMTITPNAKTATVDVTIEFKE
jgi:outer membrane protein assembly factor BamA